MARQEIQDKNVGAIASPQRRQASGVYQTQGPMQGVAKDYTGVTTLANAFGNILAETSKAEAEELAAQQRLDAAAKAGNTQGKHEVTSDQERTPFLDAVFGPNQEDVVNRQLKDKELLNKHALKIASNIQAYGNKSQEEFTGILQQSQLDALKDYDGTAVEKEALIDEFAAKGFELSKQHAKENAGYVAMENRSNVYKTTLQDLDYLQVYKSNGITSPEQATNFKAKASEIFDIDKRPVGMSRKAWVSTKMEAIAKTLEEGNIGAYRAAEEFGLFDKATKGELTALDTAKTKYETEVTTEFNNRIEQGQFDMNEAKTIQGVEDVYATMVQDLTILQQRGTEFSPKGQNKYLLGKTSAQANRFAALNRLKDSPEVKAAKKKAAKAEAEAKTLEENVNALLTKQGVYGASLATDVIQPTMDKKEGKAANDAIFTSWMQKALGEDLEPRDAAMQMLNSPVLLKKVSTFWGNNPHGSDVVEILFGAVLDTDLSGFTDEDGKLKPEVKGYTDAMEQFRRSNPHKFKTAATNDGADRLVHLQRSINAGWTVDRINKDWDNYKVKLQEGKPPYNPAWGDDGKPLTKQEHVTQFMSMEGDFATHEEVANVMPMYNRGLVLGDGDANYAKQYALDYHRNSALEVQLGNNKMTLQGGKNLTETLNLETPFEDLLKYHDSKDLFAEFVFAFEGDTTAADKKNQTPKTKLADVQNLRMYTVAGYSGFFMDSPLAPNPIPIPNAQIKEWDRIATQDRNTKALQAEKRALAEHEAAKKTQGKKPLHMYNRNG